MTDTESKTGVDAGASTGEASAGSATQVAQQALQALAQNQKTMESFYEKMMSSLTENITKVNQSSVSTSEDTSKKQDTNVDEAQANASGVIVADQTALSRLVNSQAAFHADARAHSLHRHVETMQTIIGMYLGGTQFAQNVCQNILVSSVHQQCARNADILAATVPSDRTDEKA